MSIKKHILIFIFVFFLFPITTNAHVHSFTPWIEDWEATCYMEGQKSRYCIECFYEETETIPKTENHTWDEWIIIKKPTITEEGEKERYCMECGEREEDFIPIKYSHISSFEKKKAKNVVNSYLKAAKSYNWKKMRKLMFKSVKKYGYPTTKDHMKGFKNINKKTIKWKIIDVKKVNNKYIVITNVVYPDFYNEIYNITYNNLYDAVYNNKNPTKTGNRIAIKIGKTIKKGTKKKCNKKVKFIVIKKNNKWKLEKGNRQIIDIATGNYNSAFEDATNDVLEI